MSSEKMPITIIAKKSTREIKTGSWKYLEPYYKDLTPPCVDRCLTDQDIVVWLRLIEEGRFDEAIQHIYKSNPFPAVTGRVCPHPCEVPCNRKALGGAIQIHALERFLGDYALEHNILPSWPREGDRDVRGLSTTRKIGIVGSGPAGLSAAFFLKFFGYDVTVIEKEKVAGGLLSTGIPEFRLPKYIVQKEIEKLKKLGIKFRFNETVGQTVSIENLIRQFDAVLLAIGKSASSKLGLANEEHHQVLDGVKFLKDVVYGEKVDVGENTIIVGGGNTAIDCARTVLRLGRKPRIIYRRTRKEMPAIKEEVDAAISEGVIIDFLVAPNRLIFKDNKLVGLECIRMELGPPDESGRARPIPKKGSEFEIRADTIIKAIGEYLYLPALSENKIEVENKQIKITANYQTTIDKVFACGDCANNSGTVGDAIKRGREAAYAIHTFLENPDEFKKGNVLYPEVIVQRGADPEIAKFKTFNTAYFQKEPPITLPEVPIVDRVNDFREVEKTITAQQAVKEACRCFKCGTCVFCDNCRVFCPEFAISFDGTKYIVNYEYCKGCGVCVEECPRNALHLREVNLEKDKQE
ncbi:MAG: FAD-dependent oxidoreductase [Planctomycetota bacterium]